MRSRPTSKDPITQVRTEMYLCPGEIQPGDDNEHVLVVVVRWIGSTQTLDGIVRSVLASIDR